LAAVRVGSRYRPSGWTPLLWLKIKVRESMKSNRAEHNAPALKRVTRWLMLTSLAAGLAACAYAKPNPTNPAFQGQGSPTDPYSTRLGGDAGLFTLGVSKDRGDSSGGGGGGIGVNAFLWRGALDTLSFLPLTSADPFGGVIITDWYSPADAPGERFKATAYILGRELRSDGIRVSVFRQVNQGGRWVDAPVSSVVQADIENKVLDRARKLREASGQS
jgi:hypothetical protein